MIRRYGEAVKPGQRYTRRPGVYAVLARGRQILLTCQENPVPEFQLPGGGIDAGEHPMTALHREVMEETGWKIAIKRKLGAFRRYTYMPEYGLWAEKVCSIYLAWPAYKLGAPTETGHQAVWMAIPQALDRLGNEGDRAVLAAFAAGSFQNRPSVIKDHA